MRLLAACCGLVPALASAADVPADWAFRRFARPGVPTVADAKAVRNPIDAFVLAKLEAAGLAFAPEADRRTLIRRLSFDLIGLPPTPAEVDAFVDDPSADAYDKLVDRLLASPQLRRAGGPAVARPGPLRRDATASRPTTSARPPGATATTSSDAFNDDQPLRPLPPRATRRRRVVPRRPRAALVATGFLRHYPDEYNAVNLEQRRQEILNDITDTTGAGVPRPDGSAAPAATTTSSTPITQEDYYRIQAFFAG